MGQLKEKPTVKSGTVSFVNVFHQGDFSKFTRQECSQDSLTKSKVVLLHVYMELLNYIYVHTYIYIYI